MKLEKTKIVLNKSGKTEQAITIEAAANIVLFEELVFESSSGSILIAYELKRLESFVRFCPLYRSQDSFITFKG
jgi:hypothetical protein